MYMNAHLWPSGTYTCMHSKLTFSCSDAFMKMPSPGEILSPGKMSVIRAIHSITNSKSTINIVHAYLE